MLYYKYQLDHWNTYFKRGAIEFENIKKVDVMGSFMPNPDQDFQNAFGAILAHESLSPYVNEIVDLIYTNELDRERLELILKRNKIKSVEDIKEELLDAILSYINIILNDEALSEQEAWNVKYLKRFFKIREGDFYYYRRDEVKDVLHRHIYLMHVDGKVDDQEALMKVGMQELFDLGYDEFLKLVDDDIKKALNAGADLKDLDTIYRMPEEANRIPMVASRAISQEVKDRVWNRDGGKCTQCGSQERLEFDHIIPFAKGGSNTYRNIQLLCEACNRKKQDRIG
ncbi:MAG: HNH endonuclease [Chitinophagaceae bacterium]|nr:MAG: HNH endonuclease [Chitinophagaceae bacterium]